MRFIGNEKLETQVEKLPVKLFYSPQNWTQGKIGVVGMHPEGDYISYLKRVYKNQDIVMDLSFEEEKKNFNMKVTLNPSEEISSKN